MYNIDMSKIIGLSGYARSGKDTFCTMMLQSLRNRGFVAERMALADYLKMSMRDGIINMFGIDLLNCTNEEKTLLRPMMVAYGGIRRSQTEGTFFTDYLTNKINQSVSDYVIITDIRYDEYCKDEASWLKSFKKSKLIAIERYDIKELGRKDYIGPANIDEKNNYWKIKAKADFLFEWASCSDETRNFSIVEDFINKTNIFND